MVVYAVPVDIVVQQAVVSVIIPLVLLARLVEINFVSISDLVMSVRTQFPLGMFVTVKQVVGGLLMDVLNIIINY